VLKYLIFFENGTKDITNPVILRKYYRCRHKWSSDTRIRFYSEESKLNTRYWIKPEQINSIGPCVTNNIIRINQPNVKSANLMLTPAI
jgi:hypothetical protein